MVIRSTIAGVAGVMMMMAAGVNSASAQGACPAGCDGATNWTGFWLGAGIGGNFDMIGHDWSATDGAGTLLSDGSDNTRGASGFMGTVGVGYDWNIRDRWVLGAFTDFDFGNSEHTETDNWYWSEIDDGHNPHPGDYTGTAGWKIEHNRTWNVGARLGLITSNTSMLYGLVGYSRTDLSVNVYAESDYPTAVGVQFSKDLTYHGLMLGAGLEHDLGNGLSLKGEYRYVNYGSENFLDGTMADFGGVYEADDFDLDSHSIRLTVAYKFGRSADVVEEVSYKDMAPAPSYTAPYK